MIGRERGARPAGAAILVAALWVGPAACLPEPDPCAGEPGCTPRVACDGSMCGPGDRALDGGADWGAQVPWPADAQIHYGVRADAELQEQDLGAACSGGAPRPGDLVISELLAHVPPGPDGDANGDGERHAFDDEFVEIVNRSDASIDLDGVSVTSGARTPLTFSRACLAARGALVVFSGPRGAPARTEEGVSFLRADSRLNFSNGGGLVGLLAADGRTLLEVEYGETSPGSWLLWPEIVGRSYIAHANVSGALMSPGRCASGEPLAGGCPAPSAEDSDADAAAHGADAGVDARDR